MKTANHYMLLSDFAKREKKMLLSKSWSRRLRFWLYYWSQGYSVKSAWLLAGGR